ncbi:hypothetical protein A5761_26890 [Mycolicibacterium setense]|uniref:hypothetical protein n=1 Tax=Mycolicibacterium setense TaxID=431269 RepID=UPI0007EBD0B5|nr:hypothetical protein [Mycolicibacterium setense]OBB10432.1 hypothetical protein A5761_26890 [Mycolicibacterium setense]
MVTISRGLRTTAGSYYRWHREIQESFKRSNRGARLHRMLPMMIATFLILAASVWALNATARLVAQAMSHTPEFLGELLGAAAFYPNILANSCAVAVMVALIVAVKNRILPDIRAATGWKKAGQWALFGATLLWFATTAFMMWARGITLGAQVFLGFVLWILIICFWAMQIAVCLHVLTSWFLFVKVVSLHWPWVGWALTAAAWWFSLNIAHLLEEGTKWLYPANLHYAFDLLAPFAVPVIAWYVKIPTTIAAAVPWIVEFRLLAGFRKHGETYRAGEYYQRWCNPSLEELPGGREQLRMVWSSLGRHEGGDDDLGGKAMWRELFRDVFR